jgi:peptide/nickel transport system substrate-binding protein
MVQRNMHWLRMFGLLSPVLVLIACTGTAASRPRPAPSGEFRVALSAAPETLNPNIQLDESSFVVGRSIFSHLLSLDESGRLLPELASRWQVSPDGLTYTFTLRPGVRWHDGVLFTSADVRWSLEAIARDGYAREALAPIAAIDTPDDDTVVVRLEHPWAPFASDLTGPGLAILPRHIYGDRDWRTHPANQQPIGTGPFRFAERRADGAIVLSANLRYFRPGPFVERLVFLPDVLPETVLEKLASEAVHYSLVRPPHLDPSSGTDHPDVKVQTLPTSARYYLAFNLRRQPFDDVRVRRAVAVACDRLEMVRSALMARGAPAVGWYTPDVEWAYNAAVRVPDFDLATARRLLDDAGLREAADGARLRTTMIVPDAPPLRELADVLQTQLAAIGIVVEIQRLPTSDWIRRVLNEGDFDMSLIAGSQGPDPDALRRRFASTDTGGYIGYTNEVFQSVLEEGARAVDLGARARAYHQAQEILSRDIPFVPLAEAVKAVLYHQRVSGLPQLEARELVGAFDFSLVKLAPPRSGAGR